MRSYPVKLVKNWGVVVIKTSHFIKMAAKKAVMEKLIKYSEEKEKGNIKHLIPVHINKARCNNYFWDLDVRDFRTKIPASRDIRRLNWYRLKAEFQTFQSYSPK